MYSPFLKSRHDLCRELVGRLADRYAYVSILGKQITGNSIRVATSYTQIDETFELQCGFVAKIYNGKNYSEYSFSDISRENISDLEQEIIRTATLSAKLQAQQAVMPVMDDPILKADYVRASEGKTYTIPEIIEQLGKIRDRIQASSDKIVQAFAHFEQYEVSAMFVSKNRDLTQYYAWNDAIGVAIARGEGKMQVARDMAACNSQEEVLRQLADKADSIGKLAEELLGAEMITPGVYDIITTPGITGLIAHEAFGHGVEMDMFVKHRAKSRKYLDKPVASPLISMHDGAAAVASCVGYFFDDDGVPAHDTLIIKNGILQTGISDAISAIQLGTEPTGNGRRQEPSHKAYTRMTNTFFEPGKDNVEDMIASIKYGYLLYSCENGMEDPKNWNIQCVAQYGREIRDGKLTGKIVAPVVMSGYVPDLLMSVSMVSEEWEVLGVGHCGKGYKEWVPVSDGGPYLKARCKLG